MANNFEKADSENLQILKKENDRLKTQISELKAGGVSLRNVTRALKTIEAFDEILLHSADENTFLNSVCNVIVRRRGYLLTWIGFAENDSERMVRPVAQGGFEAGYIQSLNVTWHDTERGHGPTGTAVRTSKPVICKNMVTDPLFAPWKEEALKRGYASSIALPFSFDQSHKGVLTIYASEPDAFDKGEVDLLQRLADKIGHEISSIRERNKKEKAEERYRNIFENAVEGMFQTTPDGAIILVNPAFASMYGFDSPEQMVKSVHNTTQLYVDPEMREAVKRSLKEQGFVKGFETRHFRKDRSIMWVSFCARAVRDDKGNLLYFEGTIEDITKRKEYEEAYRKAEERYRSIFDNAGEGIFQSTPDARLLLVNPAMATLFGYNSPEDMFKSVSDVTTLYVDPGNRKEFKRLLKKQGFVKDFETRYFRSDKTIIWACLNARAIRDESGAIHHYDGRIENITRRKLLVEVSNSIVSTLDLKEIFSAIRPALLRVMPADFVAITLYNAEKKQIQLIFLDNRGHQSIFQDIPLAPGLGSPLSIVMESLQPVCVDSIQADSFPPEFMRVFMKEKTASVCCIPLISHSVLIGILMAASCTRQAFTSENIDFLKQISGQIAIAIDNARAYRQISDLKNKLSEEKLYLEEEIGSEHNFGEIIGNSRVIREVLKQVEIVSPTDSTVMILGETGTGKELFARAIHRFSGRGERSFVKINCAAVPAGLLESELFGHEKGAFTGATSQRIGRFELAHQGTLFLDEVGDIPLDLQTKLLRVLQENEFERLGSTKTIKVDVRLITATNRDLSRMVSEKQFRSDLYYRLKVFPILVPPLRDRTEDIPLLVRHFTEKHAKRMNKQIANIPSNTMKSLLRYPWPGNVRELENLLERAVILSQGSILQVPLAELIPFENFKAEYSTIGKKNDAETVLSSESRPKNITTLEVADREHILRALQASNWVISGDKGAATLLGMNRSTLRSKMRKLRITRPS